MSSTRGYLKPYIIIPAGTSLGANITSAVTSINYLDNVAIQINCVTSDAIGTFDVEGSLDYAVDTLGNVTNSGIWIPITLAVAPTLAGVNLDILLDLNQLSFPYIRVTYARTSGTGTCVAYVSAKQV
jgi:hypothetical protein